MTQLCFWKVLLRISGGGYNGGLIYIVISVDSFADKILYEYETECEVAA